MHKTMVTALAAILAAAPSLAQEPASAWPSKPVTFVVSTLAGGGADAEARLYAGKLMELMGKPFIVANRTGAAGAIAATSVAKAAPDGHTYLAATTSFSVQPALSATPPYVIGKDLVAVSLMSGAPIVLIASTAFPPNNFAEYVAWSKANPGKLTWATTGAGAMNHLSGEWLHGEIKTNATFVHYKGATAILPDLLAGRVLVYPTSPANAMPHIKSGKVKTIAMMTLKRYAALPDLPTIAEQGVPDFEQPNYFGFLTTGGTSPAIIDRMNGELRRAARQPDVMKTLEAEGAVVVASTPAEFGRYLDAKVARLTRLVKEKNIKVE